MAAADANRLAEDLAEVKRDLAIIKYILSQEGNLSGEAERLLAEARRTPDHDYVELE